MTVADLISLLAKYDGDLRVVVDGYENGYDDIVPERIQRMRLCLDVGTKDYEGKHDEPGFADERRRRESVVVAAICLHRSSF